MAATPYEKRVIVVETAETLAHRVARRFLRRLSHRTGQGKTFHVILTGGSMGRAVLEAAAHTAPVEEIDWTLVHVWWGDERFVARDDDERNEKLARDVLLSHVPLPAENIHAIAASDEGIDLDAAAEQYARELARFGTEEQPWPDFDLCFLGVGPDGHIASLFPDRREIQLTDVPVTAVRNSPKPPPERVSLTRPVINSSRRVWLVLSGSDKAPALGLALAGASYDSVPVAGAKGRRHTIFFVDEAAAADVPAELIDNDEN